MSGQYRVIPVRPPSALVAGYCARRELGLGLGTRRISLYADCAGAWVTHVADSSLLVDLCLEILENTLVNHFVVRVNADVER